MLILKRNFWESKPFGGSEPAAPAPSTPKTPTDNQNSDDEKRADERRRREAGQAASSLLGLETKDPSSIIKNVGG